MSQRLITYGIASVWIYMGLICKLLGLEPRHEAIVGVILGSSHASWLTPLIGLGEICIALWIITEKLRKHIAILQIILVMSMNCLELWKASHLLLWGPLNIVFAGLFCSLIYWNSFINTSNYVETT